MQALIAGIAAAFVGIVLGFLLRSVAAKAEKAQSDRRSQELAAELASLRAVLAQAQAQARSSRRRGPASSPWPMSGPGPWRSWPPSATGCAPSCRPARDGNQVRGAHQPVGG